MNEAPGDRGFPWSFALDPGANVRALGEVQRRGLMAASQAVERLLGSTADGSTRASTADGPDGLPTTGPERSVESEVTRLLWLWGDLARSMAALSAPGAAVASGHGEAGHGTTEHPDEGVWIDAVSGRCAGTVDLIVDSSGSLVRSGELWLWNGSTEPVGPVRLHVGELRSPGEEVLGSSAVCFEPAHVDELPARTSRGIGISVRNERQQLPGVYRGIIQVAGVPSAALRLDVTVRGSSEAGQQ